MIFEQWTNRHWTKEGNVSGPNKAVIKSAKVKIKIKEFMTIQQIANTDNSFFNL